MLVRTRLASQLSTYPLTLAESPPRASCPQFRHTETRVFFMSMIMFWG